MARRDTPNSPAEQSGGPRMRDTEQGRGADDLRGVADEGKSEDTEDRDAEEDEEGTF